MSRLFWAFMVLMLSSRISECYRILVVFPMAGKSHSILGYGIVKLLLNAGHEVTYITSVIENNPNKKLRQIDVTHNFIYVSPHEINLTLILNEECPEIDYRMAVTKANELHTVTLENENVQNILEDPKEHFDLVIAEWLLSEICVGYAAVFDAPFVWVSSMEPHWLIVRLVDDYLNPAYNSDLFSSNVVPFSFLQRIEELWTQIQVLYFIYTKNNQQQKKQYEKFFVPAILKRGRQAPPFEKLIYNASLVLSNSHVSFGHAIGIPQNLKPVAGYHIADKRTPLPEDLQKIMDNAEHGVIYFSMGSILRSKDMPNKLKRSILKMFGKLKQTVVWKFEENFTNVPKNIHIIKWAPQQSILSHPKCILFITHGGMLSITETIYFGVPIIGIPVFADQFLNINRAVQKGFAKKVDLTYAMAERLKTEIDDIVKNPKYREKAKELSLIYHDRPVKPGVELVHWVEHVVKTRGAIHLRSPAVLVPWYQKIYLDFIALLMVLVLTVVALLKHARTLYNSIKITICKKQEKIKKY